ncbi:hypothetical protein SEA_CHEESETOUCH_53 [Gordonia phage CheeseTouch]
MPEFKVGDRVRTVEWPDWFAAKVVADPLGQVGLGVTFEVLYVGEDYIDSSLHIGDRARMWDSMLEHID